MKILITGVTGTIGSEVLRHCLQDPAVTSVVSLSRRELQGEISRNKKLANVIVEEFGQWPAHLLEVIRDSDAMIWAMGTLDGDTTVNFQYPLTFLESFALVLASRDCPRSSRFRYIHVSGQLTEQDHTKTLRLSPGACKIKEAFEGEAVRFLERHRNLLEIFIVRPGGVLPRDSVSTSVLGLVMGNDWSIRAEELGAYMADLAVHGDEEGIFIENDRMVQKGREVLRGTRKKTP